MEKLFFSNSEELEIYVTKQLAHIAPHWELTWNDDSDKYQEEDGSFAYELNKLIDELDKIKIQESYHENEDIVAGYVNTFLNWKIIKDGKKWIGADYNAILEQGGFHDLNQENLMLAVVGRIRTSYQFGQIGFDDMEDGHKKMLGDIIAIILYHRWNGEEL